MMPSLTADTDLFRAYSDARRQVLAAISCDDSCRDPLSEFAERLVQDQLGGDLASSRVQKDYDLTTPDGRRVQVKYLANPADGWRNEHHVRFAGEMDDYAVVFFEGFDVTAVVVFAREHIAAVCGRLGKRHPHQDRGLQLTRANLRAILADEAAFAVLGVRCFVPAI